MKPNTPSLGEEDVARCCNDIYSSPFINKLLDGIFHPGGLALSNYMAEQMGFDDTIKALDIACGDGATATYFARKFGCNVYGIDSSPLMIEKATKRALEMEISSQTEFRVAFATSIPFEANFFSAAFSECALCIFPDKTLAINEISRVLRSGGMLGINDVTVEDSEMLEPPLKSLLAQVACVAGAMSRKEFKDAFLERRYHLEHESSHSDALMKMITRSKENARLMIGLTSSENHEIEKVQTALDMIQLLMEQVKSGNIGYDLFVFRKE